MDTDVETLEEMFRTPMPESRLRRAVKKITRSLWAALIILGFSVWAFPQAWNPIEELMGLRRKNPPLR
jgi:hypothetical protein